MSNPRKSKKGSHSKRRNFQKAWAPYNFVPMPDKPIYAELEDGNPPTHDRYAENRHTGYFNVQLRTETPLFIRGMLTIPKQDDEVDALTIDEQNNDAVEIRKQPDFFGLPDQPPVIPGSSLRGMLRTLVEIVTKSKMHFVSDNKLVYRKVFGGGALARSYQAMTLDILGTKKYNYPTKRMHGGYLRRGDSPSGWVIQPAKAHGGDSMVLVHKKDVFATGIRETPELATYPVAVEPPSGRILHEGKQGIKLHISKATGIVRGAQPAGFEPATLIISNTIGGPPKVRGKNSNRTWYPAIYDADDSQAPIKIPQQMWEDFVKDRDLKRGIENRTIDEEDNVLFYLVDSSGELVFFGPTMFFRVPYANSILELVPDELNKRKNTRLDYAEAMFGYVSEQYEERDVPAYAGRVSVTSATVTERHDSYTYPPVIPRILASPKPTTTQHYLEQPNGVNTDEFQVKHYANGKQIRGHKLYWRHMISKLAQIKETGKTKDDKPITPENSTQHTRISPVKEGVTFAFKVHFQNLTDLELGALLWVLTLGGDARARHQMGMGKPLGLGVVKLDSELVLSNRTQRQGRYGALFNDDGRWHTDATIADIKTQGRLLFQFQKAVGFANDERYQHLMAMLQMVHPQRMKQRQPDKKRPFDYMKIKSDVGNDYNGQPVLPTPVEIKDGIYND